MIIEISLFLGICLVFLLIVLAQNARDQDN